MNETSSHPMLKALRVLLLPVLSLLCVAHAQTTTAPFGAVIYLQNDVTGNVILATDPNGNSLWEERYLPYGAKRLGAAGAGTGGATSTSQRYGYHNKSLDPETGLNYFGGRYYDPSSGRFSAMDPAPSANPDFYGFNRYGFANGNPYRYTDPDGRSPIDIVFLIYDVGRLGSAVYSGAGAGEALVAIGLDAVGVLVPIPGVGLALKAERAATHTFEAVHAVEGVAEAAKSGETLATKAGRQAHTDWDAGEGLEKEVRLPSGKRADAVNFETKTVKELKPNNPRAVKQGEKQVEGYRKELETEHGGSWIGNVETYNK